MAARSSITRSVEMPSSQTLTRGERYGKDRLTLMRLIVTSEHRFSLAPDGSVWTKASYGYPFWERYLAAFDAVRIVARAKVDPAISESYKAVTGTAVEFWPLPFYLGPEQFLLRRRG